MLKPPLAHRGNHESGTVTSFQFALLTGILVATRHKWEAALYQDGRPSCPPSAPATIKLTLSPYALLRTSVLPDNGRHRRALESALDRLCRPIASGLEEPLPPLLMEWFETRSGRLYLNVCGRWLDPPWVRLPLPLPLRSVNALALFLFLQIAERDATSEQTRPMDRDEVCEVLGIPFWRRALDKRRLDAALVILNRYLKNLSMETRRSLSDTSARPPARYNLISPDRGTHIRFTQDEFIFRR